MKFVVSRTSRFNDEQPCEEAYKDKFTKIKNVVGAINTTTTTETEAWYVDINALEELAAFCDEHGELVVQRCYDNKNLIEIEIYDSYRE